MKGNRRRRFPRCKESCSARPRPRSGNCWAMPTTRFTIFRMPSRPIARPSEAQPDDINHRKGLAQTLLTEEKYPEALEQYQRLSQMDADDPDNYLRLAEIYRQMKQLDKAEQNVLLAKQRAPGQPGSDLLRVLDLRGRGPLRRFHSRAFRCRDGGEDANPNSLRRAAARSRFCTSSSDSCIAKRAITRRR